MSLKIRNLAVFTLFVGITTSLAAAPRIIKKVLQPPDAVRAADYWTPERRAAAIPMDARGVSLGAREIEELVASAEQPVVRGSAGPAGTTGIAPAVSQDHWTPENAASLAQADDLRAGVEPLADDFNRFPPPLAQYKGPDRKFPYIAIGRLFMRFPSGDFSCSAAVINPGWLVATTRTCIFDKTRGGFADIVNFFPGYQNGLNPDLAGGWTARVLLTFDTGGRRFDIGIMQMFNYLHNGCKAKAGSRQILSFTGFVGTFQGGTYKNGTALQAFGYPAVNIPGPPDEGFQGKYMHQCSTHQKAMNRGGNAGTIEFGCDLTAGTTGGPVIHSFKPDHAGDRNFLRSLVSFRLAGAPNASNIEGPQFQADNFGALLNAAINEPCP